MTEIIRGAGGGGGGGGGGGSTTVVQNIVAPTRTPIRDRDNLASKQYATFLDLLGEGEIEGFPSAAAYTKGTANYNTAALKDIYLDGTPILVSYADPTATQAADYNYQNVEITPKYGTQDQTSIAGVGDIEDEKSVNIQVRQPTPVTRTIHDSNANAVRVSITVPRLERYTDEGDVLGTSVSLSIQIQYNSGGFTTVLNDTISGRTADQYQRDYKLELSGDFPVDVRVIRNTSDSADNNLSNAIYWSSYTEIIYGRLKYPNSALVAMRIDAEQFSSIPSRTYRVRGIKVRIPNNATVDQTTGRLTYSGVWDGTFGAAVWTSDPAWVLWDVLTSSRYGFGDHISASQLDKWAFFSASQYASELVPDGLGGEEPRFSCNALIQNQDDAYKLINDLCSVMRVMPFWATGTLTVSQDKPADPSYLFTLANVTEEGFTYSGSSLKTRHTVAVVSYLDLETQDIAYEVVEDHEGIAKYGVITSELKAFACTSRGQASRLGDWLLYSENHETEVVSFTASVDAGVLVRPGQVIEIADPVRAGVRRGGRVVTANVNAITVDDTANTDLTSAQDATLSVIMPDGTVETRDIHGITGNIVQVTAPFSAVPNNNTIWVLQNTAVQSSTWRVVSVQEKDGIQYSINALAYNASKYDYVERDRPLQQRDITTIAIQPNPPASLQATETLYELNNKAAVKVIISWQPVLGVSQYRFQWKREEGNWNSIDVPSPDYEILDAAAGTYYLRVYSLSATRKPSNVPTELTKSIQGKTALPVNVSGLSLVPIDEASAILSWDRATDLDVLLGGKVLLRHNTALTGAVWEESQEIVAAASGNQTQKQVPLLEGSYLAKFEDDGGRRSTDATAAVVDLPTPQARLLVQTYREDQESPPFQGNYTDMIYSEDQDGLIINTGLPVDEMALDDDWDALGTLDAIGGSLGSGEYEFGSTLNLGGVYDLNMRRDFVTRPYLPGDLWDDQVALIDTWTSIDGDNIDRVNAVLYVRTTEDDPSGTPTWGDWREFSNAINRGRGFQFKTIATSTDADQNIIIDELGCTVELQQRSEASSTLTSTASTFAVTFTNAFYQAPSVGLTGFDMATADFYEVQNITRTGFEVTFKNSAGTAVSRDFTYTAIGYGREIT